MADTDLAVARAPLRGLPPYHGRRAAAASLTRTDEEVSPVCEEARAPEKGSCERGWRVLEVAGPLEFAQVRVLASLAAPLAAAGVSLFALSAYDTDCLLVKSAALERAVAALGGARHRVENARSGHDVA